MKIRWKGETEFLVLTKDDSGEDYLYPPEKFEIIED